MQDVLSRCKPYYYTRSTSKMYRMFKMSACSYVSIDVIRLLFAFFRIDDGNDHIRIFLHSIQCKENRQDCCKKHPDSINNTCNRIWENGSTSFRGKDGCRPDKLEGRRSRQTDKVCIGQFDGRLIRERPHTLFAVGEVEHVLKSDKDKTPLKSPEAHCVSNNRVDGESTNSNWVIRYLLICQKDMISIESVGTLPSNNMASKDSSKNSHLANKDHPEPGN